MQQKGNQQQQPASQRHPSSAATPHAQPNTMHAGPDSASLTCSDHPVAPLTVSSPVHATISDQPFPRQLLSQTSTPPVVQGESQRQPQQRHSEAHTMADAHNAFPVQAFPSGLPQQHQPNQAGSPQQMCPGSNPTGNVGRTVSPECQGGVGWQPTQLYSHVPLAPSHAATMNITSPMQQCMTPSLTPSLTPGMTPSLTPSLTSGLSPSLTTAKPSTSLNPSVTPGRTLPSSLCMGSGTPQSREERLSMEKREDVDLMYKGSPVQWVKRKDSKDREQRFCSWCRDAIRCA